jgi:hypothetical protein
LMNGLIQIQNQKRRFQLKIEPQIIDQNKSTEQLRESINDLFRSFEDM